MTMMIRPSLVDLYNFKVENALGFEVDAAASPTATAATTTTILATK